MEAFGAEERGRRDGFCTRDQGAATVEGGDEVVVVTGVVKIIEG